MSDEKPIKAKKPIKTAGNRRVSDPEVEKAAYEELYKKNEKGEESAEQYIEDTFFATIADPEKMKAMMEKVKRDQAARAGFQEEKMARGETPDAPMPINLDSEPEEAEEAEEPAEDTEKEPTKARRSYIKRRKHKKD